MNAYTRGRARPGTARGARRPRRARRRGDDAPPGRLRPTTPQPGDVHALTPEQHAAAAAAFAAEGRRAARGRRAPALAHAAVLQPGGGGGGGGGGAPPAAAAARRSSSACAARGTKGFVPNRGSQLALGRAGGHQPPAGPSVLFPKEKPRTVITARAEQGGARHAAPPRAAGTRSPRPRPSRGRRAARVAAVGALSGRRARGQRRARRGRAPAPGAGERAATADELAGRGARARRRRARARRRARSRRGPRHDDDVEPKHFLTYKVPRGRDYERMFCPRAPTTSAHVHLRLKNKLTKVHRADREGRDAHPQTLGKDLTPAARAPARKYAPRTSSRPDQRELPEPRARKPSCAGTTSTSSRRSRSMPSCSPRSAAATSSSPPSATGGCATKGLRPAAARARARGRRARRRAPRARAAHARAREPPAAEGLDAPRATSRSSRTCSTRRTPSALLRATSPTRRSIGARRARAADALARAQELENELRTKQLALREVSASAPSTAR